MTTKSFKKITQILKRSKGSSLIAVIALMVIMVTMGAVFSSIMGRWKLSSPSVIHSSKALYLAETAAMYALQDASYRFYGGSFEFGTSTDDPYVVSSVTTGYVTEVTDYWFEIPGSSDDVTTGVNDDIVDDDADDSTGTNTYTIIATGRVEIDGTAVAKRQIKVKADITNNSSSRIPPGVSTEGVIDGNGNPGLRISRDGYDPAVEYDDPVPPNTPSSGSEDDKVNRNPIVQLDENMFKALSDDQGHTQSDNPFSPGDGYPDNSSSYYYGDPADKIPNITYVENGLSFTGNRDMYGVFWVNGNVALGGQCRVHGVIICEGNITLSGTASITGGIVQYGAGSTLLGNGNPSAITIFDDFFDDLNDTIPEITVVSWQEAVSAN